MRYAYKNGGIRPPVPPDQAAAEINRIRELCEGKEADLPRMLVRESKKKTALFHTSLNWDNEECGELWRTHQARQIIISVIIIEEGEEGVEITSPAFPNIAGTENRERSYEPIEVAMASQEMREALLADARQRLKNIRNKYRNLTELAAVWSAIDQAAG